MAGRKRQSRATQQNVNKKVTFEKKKKSIIKKLQELSILCGVDTCAIFYYNQNDEDGDRSVETWPSSRSDAISIINKYRNMSEMEQGRNMLNPELYAQQKIKKLSDQLKKVQQQNRQKEVENMIHQCLDGEISLKDLSGTDKNDMEHLLIKYVNRIKLRINLMEKHPELHL
ncbi:OLC1v1002196C1 [Oldenlandia corymbosa var. corymbosa]|uniref:OLC1v1002196C1 n=1 Tax=Oldenlandia corymbosa var. corymbosa TaxID=529605 RepID=A0AAV1D796_OLDCO|nr:OLC1v1002196C1 [Oldenlandia corymbosa var. corymbosa]